MHSDLGGPLDKLQSIQVLRAIAVLGVLLCHANESTFYSGAAGVDLFFVISGFIIARISDGRDRASFAFDRIWRIFPLYIICTVVFLALAKGHGTSCQAVATWTLLPLSCEPYLQVAWTLQYEMLFYAVVVLTIGAPTTLFAIIPTLVLLGQFMPLEKVGSPLLLEFLAGALIARLPFHAKAGSAVLVVAIALFVTGLEHPNGEGFDRVLWWGLPSALLVYGTLSLEFLFKAGLVTEIGNASYSIYLTHLLVMGHLDGRATWPMLVWVAVCVGLIVHWVIEKPLLRARPPFMAWVKIARRAPGYKAAR